MANTRTETDTMGPIEVSDDAYWGAQAQRSLHLLGEGTVAPLAEYFAARFRGDGEGLLIPARALPRDLDARSLLAFGQPSDGLLVLSLEGAYESEAGEDESPPGPCAD